MRVTRYVKSDGEVWIRCNIRCSAHVSYNRLNALMMQNGWIPWRLVRAQFNSLKQKLAATDPAKYPNWKEVRIPMKKAGLSELPVQIQEENEKKNVEVVEEQSVEIKVANDGN